MLAGEANFQLSIRRHPDDGILSDESLEVNCVDHSGHFVLPYCPTTMAELHVSRVALGLPQDQTKYLTQDPFQNTARRQRQRLTREKKAIRHDPAPTNSEKAKRSVTKSSGAQALARFSPKYGFWRGSEATRDKTSPRHPQETLAEGAGFGAVLAWRIESFLCLARYPKQRRETENMTRW